MLNSFKHSEYQEKPVYNGHTGLPPRYAKQIEKYTNIMPHYSKGIERYKKVMLNSFKHVAYHIGEAPVVAHLWVQSAGTRGQTAWSVTGQYLADT